MEVAHKAVRVAAGVPIWSLFEVVIDNGKLTETEIGSLTNFPNEGPMATVTFDGVDMTVSAPTVAECLVKAKAALADLEASAADYVPDEDGEIAYMRHLEDQAQEWSMRDSSYGYAEYY
tara:strand:+ start:639 stop:995 length:357 start_codon:yes stop_codon:yes gene_type:complete